MKTVLHQDYSLDLGATVYSSTGKEDLGEEMSHASCVVEVSLRTRNIS